MSKVFLATSRVVAPRIHMMRHIHTTKVFKGTFTSTDAVMPKPHTTKLLGYMGVTLATSLGIFTGAEISKNIASFLEENELFVPSDDDDDD